MADTYGKPGALYESLGKVKTAIDNWRKSKLLFNEIGFPGKAAMMRDWIRQAQEKSR